MAEIKRVRRDWPAVFEEFGRSGQTVRSFCASRGIREGLFYGWRKRLSVCPSEATGQGFVELSVGAGEAFSGVALSAGGLRVEIGLGFDAATLERVLSCLARSAACSR